MKTLLIVLFFVSALLLIYLSYDLLRMADTKGSTKGMILIGLGIVASIGLLSLSLFGYLNTPPGGNHK